MAFAVHGVDLVDFVVPQRNAVIRITVRRENIHGVSFDPKIPPFEFGGGPAVKSAYKLMQKRLPTHALAFFNRHHLLAKCFGIPCSVQTAHRRHHQHIPASTQKRRRSTQTKFFDFLVDGEVFLDVRAGGRDVGLRLVIIVVGYKVLYRVVGEKLLEFLIKLGGKGLVVAQDQRRTLHLLHHIGHSEGFPGPCNAKKGLLRLALQNSLGQGGNGGRLVSRRSVRTDQLKFHGRGT